MGRKLGRFGPIISLTGAPLGKYDRYVRGFYTIIIRNNYTLGSEVA